LIVETESCPDLLTVYPADRRAAADAAQTGLDLASGPLVRAVLAAPGELLLVVHHLAVDEVSWEILIEDLETAYLQAERGEPIALPAKTTSFRRWAYRLAGSPEFADDAEHWLSTARAVRPILRDHEDGTNDLASARAVRGELPAEQTERMLHQVPAAYGTQVNDVLLTALGLTIKGWTGDPTVAVELEGHGREDLGPDLDLSRTVGWFTTLFPVVIPFDGHDGDPGIALKQTKERLRRIPRRGLSYGVLRHVRTDPELSALPAPDISFNYLGQAGDRSSCLFRRTGGTLGENRARAGRRAHLIDVDCRIAAGRLELTWTYSERIHDRATIERLAETYLDTLNALIDHCCAPGVSGYTPSDFPLAGLDQAALDLIEQRLGSPESRGGTR
jgi:non-ribosomal peptide synthase protein (TIGR01720 family)